MCTETNSSFDVLFFSAFFLLFCGSKYELTTTPRPFFVFYHVPASALKCVYVIEFILPFIRDSISEVCITCELHVCYLMCP